MVHIAVERTIAASQERVFAWLADPANLTAAPLVLRAGFAKGSSRPGVGAVREVTGAGMWFREEITAYDPPRSYSYRILRAFPAIDHEGGTMTFSPSGQRHTRRLDHHLHPSGPCRRQGDGDDHRATAALEFSRDPRRLRKGSAGLVAVATPGIS